MCRDGQQLPFSSSPSLAAGSSATGRHSERGQSLPSNNSSSLRTRQQRPSMPSGSWWQRRTIERGERNAHAPALSLRLGCLAALFLMSSPACSLLKLKPPEAAPVVVACPIVQCLDRAMRTCEGVEPVPVKTCADAVLIASDALGEVLLCQESHAALIRCVQEFNRDNRR